MSNYGEEAIYPKDNFNELVTSVSHISELPKDEIERSLKNFENDYGEVGQRSVAEKITFYSNDGEMKRKKEYRNPCVSVLMTKVKCTKFMLL